MKAIISPLLLALALGVNAQNHVPNPSFEINSALPNDAGQWNLVSGWTNAGGSPVNGYYGDPDYFHRNGSGSVQLPDAAPANLNPHTGDAIMGFLGYHDPGVGLNDIREYLMVELSTPLNLGQTYEVSFWISNGESEIGHYLKCDGIGLCLSTNALTQSGTSYIHRTPQMEIAGEFFATSWTLQTFSFTADSSYKFLTIGNFRPDSLTSHSVAVQGPLPFAGAYYFIDDVSVSVNESNSIADPSAPLLSLHPNPASTFVRLQLAQGPAQGTRYRLCSLNGQVLRSGHITQQAEIDIAGLAAGMYVLEVAGPKGILRQRLVKE